MNIAIIGCGEVGFSYATAIANMKYSLHLCAPRPSEKIINLISASRNVTLSKKIGNWLMSADIVISCTPGNVALSVTKEAIPFMQKGALFADFSSASPADKRQGALLANANEVFFVDVVIMGAIDLAGARTPLLCAGKRTDKIVDLMKALGAPIHVLQNAEVGAAASLKLLRTVFTKGMAALAVECIVSAEFLGVKGLLCESLSDIDETPINEFLDMLLRNHVVHACRQRHEIAEATQQLRSAGLPVQLLPSIEALFATTCKALVTVPLNTVNPTTEEALAWLLETRCVKTKL